MTIYFISDGRGAIKIGYTDTSVYARLSGLQTGNASELTLLGVMDGGPEVEQELHARFASQRIRGEWFATTLELLKLIPEQPKKEFAFEIPIPEGERVDVGAMVRDWRKSKEMSQGALGQLIGVGQEVISNFEKGKRNLGLETAAKMRAVVGDWFPVESAISEARASAFRLMASFESKAEPSESTTPPT